MKPVQSNEIQTIVQDKGVEQQSEFELTEGELAKVAGGPFVYNG